MDKNWISFFIAIVAAIIALISQIIAIRLGKRVQKLERIEKLKQRYSNPLLIAAGELYNKLNDIFKNRKGFPINAFKELKTNINQFGNISDITSNLENIYLASVLYLFARFFGAVEAIKKDVGYLNLASDNETRDFQLCLRQTVAVFFSGRLFDKVNLKKGNTLKYRGTILEGTQVLIGESMLKIQNDSTEIISFLEFCEKLASDKNMKICIKPLVGLLDHLEVVKIEDDKNKDIDFRWMKLLFFAAYLRGLIKNIDSSGVVVLLEELEKEENEYLRSTKQLEKNILKFEKGYPGSTLG